MECGDQRTARGEVTNRTSQLHVAFVVERPVSSAADDVRTRTKRPEKISLCGNEGYRWALKTARWNAQDCPVAPSSFTNSLRVSKRGNTGLAAAKNEGVNIVGAFIGVHHF